MSNDKLDVAQTQILPPALSSTLERTQGRLLLQPILHHMAHEEPAAGYSLPSPPQVSGEAGPGSMDQLPTGSPEVAILLEYNCHFLY